MTVLIAVSVLFNELNLTSDGDSEAGESQVAASYAFNTTNAAFIAWDPELGTSYSDKT